ncbi:hypothetical protein [Zavarzinella formosa]|uniref:hypothetical protein n=1 Tax=Zavarzinella formosa TaxID=360055 RepID=UPI00031D0CD4|nr:hypothetical protein [Zavarzinella formosa]
MNTAILFLSLILLAPPEPPSTPAPRLTELVRQLGHRDFKTRETAARDLLKAGDDAITVLNAGVKNTDPEIAQRCRQLLPVIFAAGRQEKLTRLLKEPLGPLPKGLAGLERFIDITGDGRETRKLYAEMMTEHHAIIEAFETDPETAARLMDEFYQKEFERWQAAAEVSLADVAKLPSVPGRAALFLFVRGDSRHVDRRKGALKGYQLLKAIKLRSAVTGPEEIPGIKKLFLRWMQNEKRSEFVYQSFVVVRDAKLKEAAPEVIMFAARREWPEESRADVLDILAKIGSKEHVRDLKPLLTDTTSIGTCTAEDGRELEVQFRDVALGVSLLLAGEKLTDYEYANFGLRNGLPVSSLGYCFPDDKARQSAFAKWKDFTSKPVNKSQAP